MRTLYARSRIRDAGRHQQIAPDVLRHRIITTYEAEAENISSDHIVQRILDYTEVP